jgi:YgiT-type zinc finger domain-containing protein
MQASGKKISGAEDSLMLCLICRSADIVYGFTSISFERDEFRLLINNVPAQVCSNCGEAVLDEDVAMRLLSEAQGVLQEGEIEFVHEFGR